MDHISTVFLDRDGVINRLRSDYVLSWSTFEFLPRAKIAIRMLNEAGMRVVIVTNQRAVARGFLSVEELTHIHDNMRAELASVGATIDAIYYCPHDKGVCDCRKPDVGLFLQAQREQPLIRFQHSVVIGDSCKDMLAGRRLGCRLILVTETGRQDQPGFTQHAAPETSEAVEDSFSRDAQPIDLPLDGVAPTLYDAVKRYILRTSH